MINVITLENQTDVVPSAAYMATITEDGGKTFRCYGIVGGDSIPGILERSTVPNRLRFVLAQ